MIFKYKSINYNLQWASAVRQMPNRRPSQNKPVPQQWRRIWDVVVVSNDK